MKTYLGKILLISYALIACNIALTGCGDKTAKLEPNNWNCRPDKSIVGNRARPRARLERQEKEHKIKDAAFFRDKCEELKLGYYSDEYNTLRHEEIEALHDRYQSHILEDKRKQLLAKWQQEAGVSPNDY